VAEPAKIVAPVGSVFRLRWTVDRTALVHNHFKTEQGELVHDGDRPPGRAIECDVMIRVFRRKADPNDATKMVDEEHFFRDGMKRPECKPSPDRTRWIFTHLFKAREEGELAFTVTLPGGEVLRKEVVVAPLVVSEKRQLMLSTIDRWFPSRVSVADLTSAQNPPADMTPEELARAGWHDASKPPAGLMDLAGWGEKQLTRMQYLATDSLAGKGLLALELEGMAPGQPLPSGTVPTSCGDVLSKVLSLWGVDFDANGQGSTRAFGIRDDAEVPGSTPKRWMKGAIPLGYYQDAFAAFSTDPPTLPSPGDVVVVQYHKDPVTPPVPDTPGKGAVGHVGIVVSATEDEWVMAEGGQGNPPSGSQAAELTTCEVMLYRDAKNKAADEAQYPHGRPMLVNPYNPLGRFVDGWIVLDRVPNVLFCDVCGKSMAGDTSRCGPPSSATDTKPCGVYVHSGCLKGGLCPKCS
jgi:hypothetical protein